MKFSSALPAITTALVMLDVVVSGLPASDRDTVAGVGIVERQDPNNNGLPYSSNLPLKWCQLSTHTDLMFRFTSIGLFDSFGKMLAYLPNMNLDAQGNTPTFTIQTFALTSSPQVTLKNNGYNVHLWYQFFTYDRVFGDLQAGFKNPGGFIPFQCVGPFIEQHVTITRSNRTSPAGADHAILETGPHSIHEIPAGMAECHSVAHCAAAFQVAKAKKI